MQADPMMTQENTLGRYKVLHELGRGATGAVYAARDRSTGVVVALKKLDPALFNKPEAKLAGLFLKAVRSAQRLKHRNIVETRDAAEARGTAYVAMELLEGESLRNMLDHGPLPIARAIQIAHDIACGLAYAHLEGVVHGSLKPSNIIVLRSGIVKITDFGIGQLGQAALLSGARAGCPGYLSPEQVRGGPVDHRSDIFSLGAVFYEMLTHRPPFEGDSAKAVMENILHAEPPPPSELNPHVPRALDGIVSSMLARQPDDRMSGAPILLRDLQRLEEGLGLGPADEPTANPPPAGPEPRPRTPDPKRFRDRAPIQDAPRFAPLASDEREAMFMMDRESEPERSSGSRPAIFAALALVLALLAIGLTGFMYYSSGPGERRTVASSMQEAPATAPAPPLPTAPAPVAEATQEPATAPAAPEASPPPPVGDATVDDARAEQEPSPSAQAGSSVAREPEQPAAADSAPAQEVPRATQPTAKVPEQQPGGTAKLIIAVSPHGEIYIDGKHYGTTPPITTLDLEPGMHRIEIRGGSRSPYLTYMTVQAGDVRRIRHDFAAKPIRPPG